MKCEHEGCGKKATVMLLICTLKPPWNESIRMCQEHAPERLRAKADEVEGVVWTECPRCHGEKWITATDGVHAVSFRCVCPECMGAGRVKA